MSHKSTSNHLIFPIDFPSINQFLPPKIYPKWHQILTAASKWFRSCASLASAAESLHVSARQEPGTYPQTGALDPTGEDGEKSRNPVKSMGKMHRRWGKHEKTIGEVLFS